MRPSFLPYHFLLTPRAPRTDKMGESFAVRFIRQGPTMYASKSSAYRAMSRWPMGLVVAVCIGCASDGTHRREVRQIEPTTLAADWSETAPNTYTIHQKEKTLGRFPCSLAIVRVTSLPPVPDQPSTGQALSLDLLKDIEGVPWVELFDNFPAVSGVYVLGRPAVVFTDVPLSELITAARRHNATLCLVYGHDNLAGGLVRMVGALYDCESGSLVATIGAQVEPIPALPRPRDRVRADKRHVDPECLTAARFQELVLRCIDELKKNDLPIPTTQPNPWDRPGVFPMVSPWSAPIPAW